MFSSFLKIPQIALNQANAYITHNDAIDYLEQAAHRRKTNTSYSSNIWTVAEADFIRNMVFQPSGAAANFSVKFPDTVNSVTTERVFVVYNADTTYTATVTSVAGGGTTLTLTPGQAALIYQNSNNFIKLAWWDNKPTAPYNVAAYKPGLPTATEVIFQYVTPTAFTMADELAGSYGYVEVNPTASAAFDVLKNGSSVGTITVSTLGVFTFTTAGGSVSMAAGDRLTVTAPGTPDATLSGFSVSLAGTRTL